MVVQSDGGGRVEVICDSGVKPSGKWEADIKEWEKMGMKVAVGYP
jgi:hypothetical protein